LVSPEWAREINFLSALREMSHTSETDQNKNYSVMTNEDLGLDLCGGRYLPDFSFNLVAIPVPECTREALLDTHST